MPESTASRWVPPSGWCRHMSAIQFLTPQAGPSACVYDAVADRGQRSMFSVANTGPGTQYPHENAAG